MVRNVEVIFLGTSGGVPTPERGLPSIFIRDWRGFGVLFDIGEGVQYKMIRYGIPLSKINVIAITHAHGDHINGLPGLLQTLYMLKRNRSLLIICDRNSSRFIREVLEVERIPFSFPIKIITIKGEGWINLYSIGGDELNLYWRPSCHSVESYMYKLVWTLRPRLNLDKLKALGIEPDVKIVKSLFEKGVVKIGSKIVRLSDVSKENVATSIVYTGDTAPCSNLEEFARKARLLIHDSTFDSSLEEEAHERGHSTAREAALLAKKAKAYLLILTHISARYRGSEASVLLKEARAVHENTLLAWDGMRITLTV